SPIHCHTLQVARERSDASAAEQAHAADRCARKIIDFLTVIAGRLRRLMGRPLGRLIEAHRLRMPTSCATLG
ncbi:MAG: hypothetical protein M3R61_04950, partial [Chloroflexota bacterium]|nr:hypothetical protein [Chloroflexota bacterium]